MNEKLRKRPLDFCIIILNDHHRSFIKTQSVCVKNILKYAFRRKMKMIILLIFHLKMMCREIMPSDLTLI